MEPKKLNIPNSNNILACDVFGYISLAPDKETMPPFSELEQMMFYIKHNDQRIFLKLKDIALYKFNDVPYNLTLLCNGMMADEWRVWWLQQKPGYVNPSMAVYFYEKVDYLG